MSLGELDQIGELLHNVYLLAFGRIFCDYVRSLLTLIKKASEYVHDKSHLIADPFFAVDLSVANAPCC